MDYYYYYQDDQNSPPSSSSTSKPPPPTEMMRRSVSQRSGGATPLRPLPRSYSQKTVAVAPPKSGSSFGRKCKNLAKEQKAKFYIVKRCIAMLVRRNKHCDDDDDDGGVT